MKANDLQSKSRGEWWVAAQVVVFTIAFVLPHFVPGGMGHSSVHVLLTGKGIFLFGVIESLYGALALGKDFTPFPRPVADGRVVSHSAYTFVRHPIYGGIILMGLAQLIMWPSVVTAIGFVILAIFGDRKAVREETWLIEAHPEYVHYRARTKKFIPWVY